MLNCLRKENNTELSQDPPAHYDMTFLTFFAKTRERRDEKMKRLRGRQLNGSTTAVKRKNSLVNESNVCRICMYIVCLL